MRRSVERSKRFSPPARHEARLRVWLGGGRRAEAVAQGLRPDNFKTPEGLKVETWAEGEEVVSRISCAGRFESLLATLDDLLHCLIGAERAIEAISHGRPDQNEDKR